MTLLLGFVFSFFLNYETAHARAIYGEDSRTELRDVKDPQWLKLYDSTVVLLPSTSVSGDPFMSGYKRIKGQEYGSGSAMCKGSRFYQQFQAGFCSGTLVGPDLILTAGHCVERPIDCRLTKFAFGFAYGADPLAPKWLPEDEIYGCKEVVHSVILSETRGDNVNLVDFALVRLDRPVPNHDPIEMEANHPEVGDPLLMIGHPYGLPAKFATGKVRATPENRKGYFMTNLDAMSGNSGSFVFDLKSGKLAGILVRGPQDVFRDPNFVDCGLEIHYPEEGGPGEQVTDLTTVLNWKTPETEPAPVSSTTSSL